MKSHRHILFGVIAAIILLAAGSFSPASAKSFGGGGGSISSPDFGGTSSGGTEDYSQIGLAASVISLLGSQFEGDVVREIELEGTQLTASAATAEPGILDRLAIRISSWYSSVKNFIKGAFEAPPELQDQSKMNIYVDVIVEPPLGTPPQIEFSLMVTEGFIAVHKFLQKLEPNNKWHLDNVVKGSVTIDEAVGILHNIPLLEVGNWRGIVDILKPGNEYSMNEAYTELVRAAVIVRAAKINKSLLEELK